MGDAAAPADRPQARDAYRQSLAIRQKLAAADAADMHSRRDLALVHDRLADLAAADGSSADALASLRAALALREQIAQADPDNAAWQSELAVSLVRLARAGDAPQPRLARALALLQRLDAAGKLDADRKPMIAAVQQALAALPQPQGRGVLP